MSASIDTSRAKSRLPALTLPQPRLTVVPRPARAAARLPFVALVVGLLGAGLIGLLLLNTGMERGAFKVTALRAQVAALDIRQQALQLQVAALQDPQAVAERAQRLGMVPNVSPAFLDLRTGKVLGTSVPATSGSRWDIGSTVGPTVGRLAKIPPLVAGAATSAGAVVVVPRADPPKGARQHGAGQTNSGDTAQTSPDSGR